MAAGATIRTAQRAIDRRANAAGLWFSKRKAEILAEAVRP